MKLAGLPCAGARTRREFIRVGSLSVLGVSLSQYLEVAQAVSLKAGGNSTSRAKAESCILIFLGGGASQMDTWDPKPNSPVPSPFKPIGTNVAGIQICELYPRVAKHMDKLSIIRSMHTEENNHPQGTHYTLTGHKPNPSMKFPSLGSIIVKEKQPRNELPANVLDPAGWNGNFYAYEDAFGPAFIGAEYSPMLIPDVSQENFQVTDLTLPESLSLEGLEYRKGLLKMIDEDFRRKNEQAEFLKMDTFREQALRMVLSPAVRKAFDLGQESEKTKDAYGRHRFGQGLLLARRLVEAGCRFVTASGYKTGQWDTHGNHNKINRDDLAPPLDQALPTLLQDLDDRGLLESTLVIVMGEFGRTPHINPAGGRDHWPDCWSLLLGGGGLQSGQVVGASDERGAYVAERMVTIGDLFATLYKAFGIDWTKSYMSPIGRPLYIANSIGDEPGEPIRELI